MKIFLIFPVILSAVLTKFRAAPVVVPFKSVRLTPLYYGKTSTFIIDSSSILLSIKFILNNDIFTDKEILSKQFTLKGIHKISYNNEFTRSSNQITIKYKVGYGSWKSIEPITLNPPPETYINLVDNKPYTSKGTISVFTFSTLSWTNETIDYSFSNFDGIYVPDYYHKIKLDDFLINVSSNGKDFFKCEPSLIITNYNGVFNDISTSGTVEFPLKLISTSQGFTFELKDIIYVHKETLLLSKTEKEGYVKTKHIYLPRNEMKNQKQYKAFFALQNFGINNDFIRHNFTLNAYKNVIGDCQNSEYCVARL